MAGHLFLFPGPVAREETKEALRRNFIGEVPKGGIEVYAKEVKDGENGKRKFTVGAILGRPYGFDTDGLVSWEQGKEENFQIFVHVLKGKVCARATYVHLELPEGVKLGLDGEGFGWTVFSSKGIEERLKSHPRGKFLDLLA